MANTVFDPTVELPQIIDAPLDPLKRTLPKREGPIIQVSIVVNGQTRSLSVHRRLLPPNNLIKTRAVEDHDAETLTTTIILKTGMSYEYYENYITSLYDGDLKLQPQGHCQRDYLTLSKLYDFGAHMQDQRYQDHVMKALRHRMFETEEDESRVKLPNANVLRLIYEQHPENSLFRKWAIDACTATGDVGPYLKNESPRGLSAEIMLDLLARSEQVRQPEALEALKQTFRDDAPWPYFLTISGDIEEGEAGTGSPRASEEAREYEPGSPVNPIVVDDRQYHHMIV